MPKLSCSPGRPLMYSSKFYPKQTAAVSQRSLTVAALTRVEYEFVQPELKAVQQQL